MYLRTCSPSGNSNQTARMYLWRIFLSLLALVFRLLSHCADMQTDLSLRMTHMSESTFFHVVARCFNITAINNQVTLHVRMSLYVLGPLFVDCFAITPSRYLKRKKKKLPTRYCMAVTPTAVRSQGYGTPLPISLTSICGHLGSLITVFVHKFEQIY